MPETMSHPPNQEMFGLPARPLVETVDSAHSLARLGGKRLLPFGVYQETLQTAVDVWPLVQAVKRGRRVNPGDVRPYADDIFDNIVTSPALQYAAERKGDYSAARKLRWASRFRDVGYVRDRALPEVEERFHGQVKNLLESPDTKQSVANGLEIARPYAEVVAGYDDPRGQYLRELDALATDIRYHTREARDARLAVEYARYPAGTFRGKILRWRHSKKNLDQLIKPRDAARGIDYTFRKILTEDPETTQTPMLRGIIETALGEPERSAVRKTRSVLHETLPPHLVEGEERIRETAGLLGLSVDPAPTPPISSLEEKIPRLFVLEAAAPEIMQVLEAPLAENRQDPGFLKSIKKRFSFKAKLGRFFKRSKLERLGYRGPEFLKAVRDVLPRSGREVTRAMDEVREFFLT